MKVFHLYPSNLPAGVALVVVAHLHRLDEVLPFGGNDAGSEKFPAIRVMKIKPKKFDVVFIFLGLARLRRCIVMCMRLRVRHRDGS